MLLLEDLPARAAEVRFRLAEVRESEKPKGRALDIYLETNISAGNGRSYLYALTTYASFAEEALFGEPLNSLSPQEQRWYKVRNWQFKADRGMLVYPSQYGRWCFDRSMCFVPTVAPAPAPAARKVKKLVLPSSAPPPDVFDLPPLEPPPAPVPVPVPDPAPRSKGSRALRAFREDSPAEQGTAAGADDLNPRQREAALEHEGGPLLLLAGAGAGKTKTLSRKVIHLVRDRRVEPRSILVTTFTKKAGDELRSRLGETLGERELEDMAVGTFHSICLRLLREETKGTPAAARYQRILGTETQADSPVSYLRKVLGRGIVEETGEPAMDLPDAEPGEFLRSIALFKNGLVKSGDVAAAREATDRAGMRLSNEALQLHLTVYKKYEALKRAAGVVDFDDLLTHFYERLEKVPAFREKMQRRFKWVLVDEAQDNSKAQWEIAALLAAPENNLVPVGDDYQAIYSWRGARPEYMLDFEKRYPQARRIVLGTNYRSTPEIVDLGSAVVKFNKNQLHKDLRAHRPSASAPAEVFAGGTPAGEAQEVVQRIQRREYPVGGVAVLYRTNAQAAAVEMELLKARIPYVVEGGVGFFRRAEIQDALAYLRLGSGGVRGRAADEALKRIYNKPNRYLGKAFLDQLLSARGPGQTLVSALESFRTHSRFGRGVGELLGQLKRIEEALDLRARWKVLEGFYLKWLEERKAAEGEGDNDRTENFFALGAVIETFAAGGGTFEQFLDFAEKSEKALRTRKEAVRLSTIHRAKGLEYDVVFLVGAEEGILPHPMNRDPEEERRLMYVAVTRAKTHLHIGYHAKPSRFLREVNLVRGEESVAPAGFASGSLKSTLERIEDKWADRLVPPEGCEE